MSYEIMRNFARHMYEKQSREGKVRSCEDEASIVQLVTSLLVASAVFVASRF